MNSSRLLLTVHERVLNLNSYALGIITSEIYDRILYDEYMLAIGLYLWFFIGRLSFAAAN